MQNDLPGLSAILSNPILNTDSYKASHYLQYPAGTSAMFSYVESRGGRYDRTVFFGLQMLAKEYLCRPITPAMIDAARGFFAAHGEPFNEAPAGATSSSATTATCRCASARCRRAAWCPTTMC